MRDALMEHAKIGAIPLIRGVLMASSGLVILDALLTQTVLLRTPPIPVLYGFPVGLMVLGTMFMHMMPLRELEQPRSVGDRIQQRHRCNIRASFMCTIVLMTSALGWAFAMAHDVFIPPRHPDDTTWPGTALVLCVLALLLVNMLLILTSSRGEPVASRQASRVNSTRAAV
jgi:hypothetical protein